MKIDEINIVVSIPRKTGELKFEASIIENGEIAKLSKALDAEAIRESRQMYLELDPNDDAFAIYRLTPEYQEYLNRYGYDASVSFEEFLEEYKEENKEQNE